MNQEELQAYIVTWVTHNSRVSERMVIYGVMRGVKVTLDPDAEEIITLSISKIVKADQLKILAYNICTNHVHMVIVCKEHQLPMIVQKF